MRAFRSHPVLQAAVAVLTLGVAAAAFPGTARADATDDFPIPRRAIHTTCTPEQLLAAARDVTPVYYDRYMRDYNNHSLDVQEMTRDKFHWFYSLSPADRRAYSEDLAGRFAFFTEPLGNQWPNHTKIFWNNKGVVAKTTEVCNNYPPDDQSVWDW